jgi:VanZ family protein
MARRGNKWHYFPALIWGLVILCFTSLPYLNPPPLGFTWQDKVEHFGAYAIFGAAIIYGNIRTDKRYLLLGAVLFVSVFGLLDEVHQHWIPGRSTDPYDWIADTLGALAGASILLLSQRFWLPWFGKKATASK